MLGTAISVAFWTLFPLGVIYASARLLGTFLKNGHVAAARWHVDDGAAKGEEVYRFEVESDRLVHAGYAVAALLAAALLLGGLGGAVLKIAALVAAAVLTKAAARIRSRHAALEERVERATGDSLNRFHRRLNGEATLA